MGIKDLLIKPLVIKDLAKKVREVLEKPKKQIYKNKSIPELKTKYTAGDGSEV